MTKSTRRTLAKTLIPIIAILLLAAVLAMQAVYAPVSDALLHVSSSVSSQNYDSMNGVGIKYTPAPNGLGDDYSVADKSVSSLKTPAKDELVKVIVTVGDDSIMKYASDRGLSVAQALKTPGGAKKLASINEAREKAVNSLGSYIKERRYSYSTVTNAFSASVRYGDIAAIEKNPLVKNVIISQTYAVPQAVTENYVEVYSTGIFDSSKIDYDGTGTVVAVVDTGTDYTHEVFDMELDSETLAITKDDVAAVVPVLAATSQSAEKEYVIDEDDLYIKSKLPFAYDYADSDTNVYPHNSHGTHVAGIIAGKSDTITGVATGAQIATFKVFSDYREGAESEWILAALNDAVALGVDAINMSLGTSCGFAREEDEENVNEIYDAINDAGICLVVAASNDASSAQNSTWGNTNLASNPDSGTVGSPGTYPASLTVGSVSGVKTSYFTVNGEEIYYSESRLVGKTDPNNFVQGMLGDKQQGEFEYVVIPGIGLSVNYSGLDVEGKIAVIRRGSTSFQEKVRVAAEHGAVGAIVYNNVSGTITMSVGTKVVIPSCFVTMDYSANMVAAGTGIVKLSREYLAGPFMSDFSSWGALPNLVLAPDITAHGGEIYSAVAGGNLYDKYSGTSMATPNLAGALILVREFVKENNPEYTTNEVRDESYSRMMSTATIVRNEEGNPYSPRKQGAGLADIANSIKTKAFLTVDGSNKPKLSLGDDPDRTGVYKLKFNLVNTSGSALSYTFAPYVMTETISADNRTVAEKAYLFEDTKNVYTVTPRRGKASVSGDTISISGYGVAAITVQITLSDADKAYLNKNFLNGMYVEGYVRLLSNNSGGTDLNLPYLAFFGDWTDAPMLDVSEYEVGASAVDDSVLAEDKLVADVYGTIPYSGFASPMSQDGMGYYGMGQFAYIPANGYDSPPAQEKYAALTTNPDGDYLFYMVRAGLLRGAKRVDMEIRNSATGELIWSGVDYNARKSHASGEQIGGYVNIELDIRTLDLPNNSKYTFTMTCYLDWKDKNDEYTYGNKNTFSFEFTVDNEAPTLTDVAVRKEKNGSTYRYWLDLTVYDNHYVQGYSISTYDSHEGEESIEGYRSITGGVVPVDSEYNKNSTFSYNISQYWNHIQAKGGRLYVSVFDYAKNQSSYFLEDDTLISPETDINIAKTRSASSTYEVVPNGQVDLTEYINVTANTMENVEDSEKVYLDGYWTPDLIWESSDPDTVSVQNGVVTGLKNGSAVITVRTPDKLTFDEEDVKHCLKFNVNVSGKPKPEIAMTGIELSAETVALERGEEITITAKIKPYNFTGEYKLNWASTSANVKRISVSEDGLSAVFKAMDSGNAQIRATVEGSRISGYCSVRVQPEYVLYSNYYLREYVGRGDENGVVEIPDDLGIIYIYPRAFANNEYIKKVIIPEGVTTIMEYAFIRCTALEEVVLPESCETIDKIAFTYCENLKKINLGNVKTIGDSSFWGCSSLTELDLSKCTYIDNYAFAHCTGLTGLDLSRVGIVGAGAFTFCTGLTELVIPANTSMSYDKTYLETIGVDKGGVFSWCSGLTNVTIHANSVGIKAFYACFTLKSVTFMNDVEVINEGAFEACEELTDVKFYGSVYKIGDYAFSQTKLKTFKIPDGLTILGSKVFLNATELSTVKVSSGALLTNIDYSAFIATSITSFEVEDGNKYLASDEKGVLFDRTYKTLIAYPYFKAGVSYKVPDSVRIIGKGAFSFVYYLTSVDLNNVEYIEADAFNAEDKEMFRNTDLGISSVTNYGKVRYIGDFAFAGSRLDVLPLSNVEYIGRYAFADIKKLGNAGKNITIPASVTHIGEGAFAGTNITSVSFGNCDIESVGSRAFEDCSSLVSVGLGKLSELSEGMFKGCSSLGSVVIPDTVKTVLPAVFEDCTSLTSATLPSDITCISDKMFKNTMLGAITVPASVTAIKSYAFADTSIAAISLTNVTEIGDGAFAGCKSLTSAASSAVLTVGDGAFENCDHITQVSFANAVSVGKNAFKGASALGSVSLGKVKTVGERAFADCSSLASVTLGAAETVDKYAFENASALATVGLPKLKQLGYGVFGGSALATVNLPATLDKVAEGAFMGANSLTAITVDSGNTRYIAKDGVLYSVNDKGYYTLICYPAAKTDAAYFVIDKTIKLGANSFSANTVLATVTLPVHLSAIGDSAFAGMTGLRLINIYAVAAPSLESRAFLEIEYTTDDEGMPVEKNNYYNKYNNFPFEPGKSAPSGFEIVLAANATGYDNRIWKSYVGDYMTKSDKLHVSASSLDYIDRINKLPAQPTAEDSLEISTLLRLYNLFDQTQKAFIRGNYDFKNGNNTIDSDYYTALLGKTDYYAKLTAAQSRLPKAAQSAVASFATGEGVEGLSDVNTADITGIAAIAALALLIAIAIVPVLARKRRGE